MLVGLLFAIEAAADQPGTLVACLPFAGVTLIEHQARRLIAAGVTQIVVVGRDPSPALLGALHRIGRCDVTLDAVRGMAEAAGRLHPLSRVLVLADGLVTTDAAITALDRQPPGDALLTVASDGAPATLERIGGASAWAGIARLDARRVGEAARLPADYDPQSSLLRVAEAAGAAHLMLPLDVVREGHGVERDVAALTRRARRLMAGAAGERHGWFDRLVTVPLARLLLPRLVATAVPTGVAAGIATTGGLAGLILVWAGSARTGMLLSLVTTVAAALWTTLAVLRDEKRLARAGFRVGALLPGLAIVLLGQRTSVMRADGGPLATALALVVAALLAERALAGGERGRWWGSPPAYLLVVTALVVAGATSAGLVLGAVFAALTLAAIIEKARHHA